MLLGRPGSCHVPVTLLGPTALGNGLQQPAGASAGASAAAEQSLASIWAA